MSHYYSVCVLVCVCVEEGIEEKDIETIISLRRIVFVAVVVWRNSGFIAQFLFAFILDGDHNLIGYMDKE